MALPGLLLLIPAMLLIAILLNKLSSYSIQRILHKKGIEAEAVILQWGKSKLSKKNMRVLEVQLQVANRNGRDFIAETKELLYFTDVDLLKPGTRLKVKYNPANPRQVMILKN